MPHLSLHYGLLQRIGKWPTLLTTLTFFCNFTIAVLNKFYRCILSNLTNNSSLFVIINATISWYSQFGQHGFRDWILVIESPNVKLIIFVYPLPQPPPLFAWLHLSTRCSYGHMHNYIFINYLVHFMQVTRKNGI
jgi:hypothetical protein